MDINEMSNQPIAGSISKKHLAEILQLKLTNSLDEYHLKGKKFRSTLQKASRSLASIIAKQNRKRKMPEA